MKPATQWMLALLWAALLAALGLWAAQRLEISGDLRAFLPAPETPAQRLLIEELGDGPGSRLLLVGLSGADAGELAAQSESLREALAADPLIEFVANGAASDLAAIPPQLLPYRYLLSERFDDTPLDADMLREALDARLQDLGSPAGALVEPLLPSDPTLEILHLAESWEPENGPQRLHGVWFDAAGAEALLVVRTHAAGFDPTGQAQIVATIEAAFADAAGDSGSRLTLTGPGAFSVEIGNRTAKEAATIGAIGTLGLVLLFVFAYRSARLLLLGVLPLATAGLAGFAAVAALFDGIHGITLAFGFTLIGVAQDYPVHLFSHLYGRHAPATTARELWPTLLTGVISTCIAYLTFFVAGVDGLRQLAVFTIVGLLAAALATRYLLPPLLAPRADDVGQARWVRACARVFDRVPRPRPVALSVVAVLALAVVVLAPAPFWENDLSKLTPVPEQGMRDDMRLREALGAPDVRYLMVLHGADEQAVLAASATLLPALDALVDEGALGSYELAARYLPTVEVQRARQARLPTPDALRTALDTALLDSPFRADAFAPFLADVETARAAAPLVAADLAGTPLDAAVSGMLLSGGDGATALVSLGGLDDPQRVADVARAHGAELLDLKTTSESLVSAWRGGVLLSLALAALLLAATVWVSLRTPRRVWRVLLPMGLTLLLTLALLRGAGIELTLFHLVSLVLAAGLGLDYALFFERASADRDEHLRTLHAIVVCSSMTALVFGLLALSSIPVLRAIGMTVTLGVIGNFVFAVLLAGHAGPARTQAA
ncbi:hypothetical protein E5843_13815 [Luteimonas yindakuii]|uniref:MMPL family transporter n=1 Tax=Luteimonas yindakuii TaxID=2565782 RepID=UPI001107889B|nr:MMPL family transporter [Luteimonas yindakuii]QCO68579.2 hypothetical protein E5843_13815 [Luteimonas yindakuii]